MGGQEFPGAFGGCLGVVVDGLDLDPVASRQQHRLLKPGVAHFLQKTGNVVFLDEQAVAQAHGA